MKKKYSNLFNNKNILVIGGTGSIGSEIVEELTSYKPNKIRIFSRDEYKQHQLRYKYSDNKNIEYVLGDVRDRDSLHEVTKNIDILFHCAALKHVPVSEEMPEEFIKTNIHGSLNVKRVALDNNISTVISISTDKAVNPTNVMGLTKAIQEKVFSSHVIKKSNKKIKFINVRFGNVIGTHGSLFPILYHQMANKLPITMTVGEMTRFFMSKSDAINLIFWSTAHGNDGETVIKKMKSVQIEKLILAFIDSMKTGSSYPINKVGVRVGEKMHESLITEDELLRTKEKSGYFVVTPYTKKQIDVNVVKNGVKGKIIELDQLSSQNAENQLSSKELSRLISEFISETAANSSYI
jgi:FlaA1/EpsC-like NDP-sugar epimerase